MRGHRGAPLGEAFEAGLAAHEHTEVLVGGDEDGSGGGARMLHQTAQ